MEHVGHYHFLHDAGMAKDYAPQPVEQVAQEIAGLSATAPVDINVPGVDTSTTTSDIPAAQISTTATTPTPTVAVKKVK